MYVISLSARLISVLTAALEDLLQGWMTRVWEENVGWRSRCRLPVVVQNLACVGEHTTSSMGTACTDAAAAIHVAARPRALIIQGKRRNSQFSKFCI